VLSKQQPTNFLLHPKKLFPNRRLYFLLAKGYFLLVTPALKAVGYYKFWLIAVQK
jgi:hypothetical protein